MQPKARFENGALSVIPDAPGGLPLRRNGKHDETQRKHRQSHEFEHQPVHGKLPYKTLDL
jgi:hypothetical protein